MIIIVNRITICRGTEYLNYKDSRITDRLDDRDRANRWCQLGQNQTTSQFRLGGPCDCFNCLRRSRLGECSLFCCCRCQEFLNEGNDFLRKFFLHAIRFVLQFMVPSLFTFRACPPEKEKNLRGTGQFFFGLLKSCRGKPETLCMKWPS